MPTKKASAAKQRKAPTERAPVARKKNAAAKRGPVARKRKKKAPANRAPAARKKKTASKKAAGARTRKTSAKRQPVPKKKTAVAKTKPAASKREAKYQVVLRAREGAPVEFAFKDSELYPKAVVWNRLLASDQGQEIDWRRAAPDWHERGRKAIIELAGLGGVSARRAREFLDAAATSDIVQVEIPWAGESIGWAARVLPWEALLSLATKEQRQDSELFVVRWLRGTAQPDRPKLGCDAAFAVSGKLEGKYDGESERAAIAAALGKEPTKLGAATPDELRREIDVHRPKIVHYVLPPPAANEDDDEQIQEAEQVAHMIASHGPKLVMFSSCYSGRRMAPLAVAHGAQIAIGFHGIVFDSSIPAFIGAFYRSWSKQADVIIALSAGLVANTDQPRPGELGTVTVWSASDLLETAAARVSAPPKQRTEESPTGTCEEEQLLPHNVLSALQLTCTPADAVNYSMLHNRHGGLFEVFDVHQVKNLRLPDLEVTVRLDTGRDRPAECHFFAPLPGLADRRVDLAEKVTLPLGSQLLRRRGEMLLGSLEVIVRCGATRVRHLSSPIKLPPCDEWLDQRGKGRLFLPSFIFPRSPAVREIISAAHPALKALLDNPNAGFDGYQSSFVKPRDVSGSVKIQARAIWAAVQDAYRLNYISPPPSYERFSQRIRTPEEILRARRGTCIEVALLLASCWERIGLQPVIFLTRGHAFAGYWSDENAPGDFRKVENLYKHAADAANDAKPDKSKLGGLIDGLIDGTPSSLQSTDWMFSEPHHLTAIRAEVGSGRLVPIEATFLSLGMSFKDARRKSKETLIREPAETFDGMLDVQAARKAGVTPLAIAHEGVVA